MVRSYNPVHRVAGRDDQSCFGVDLVVARGAVRHRPGDKVSVAQGERGGFDFEGGSASGAG